MALINCPECESEVSDKAKSCPKCGYPTADIIKNKASCPECEAEIPDNVKTCPECGYPIDSKTVNVTTTPTNKQVSEPQANKLVPPEMPGVLVGAIVIYVLNFCIGLVDASSTPNISPELAIIALGLAIANLVGFIQGCRGREWGKNLFIITLIFGDLMFIKYITPIELILDIACAICFLVPSAQKYYTAYENYRKQVDN